MKPLSRPPVCQNTGMKALWQKLERRLRRIKIFNEGFTFADEMGRRSLPTNAASISFYFFVSAVPFFILLCSQLPYTGIPSEALVEAVTRLTPDAVDALAADVISQAYTSRIALFSASLLALMWSSSKVVTATIRSLDTVYGQTDRRNYFKVTANALLYTGVLLLGSSAVLFLMTKGQTAEAFLLSLLPGEAARKSFAVVGRRALGVLFSVIFFALIYTLFPAGRRNYLLQLPGALVAQTGILLFTSFYTLYQTRRNVYTSFYGNLASIAVSMVWLYTCVILFLLGGVFNARYQDRIRTRFIKRKRPKGTEEK